VHLGTLTVQYLPKSNVTNGQAVCHAGFDEAHHCAFGETAAFQR
jgi:hypothetical protein